MTEDMDLPVVFPWRMTITAPSTLATAILITAICPGVVFASVHLLEITPFQIDLC
jgi:hypothetical protein